ncbi:MAG: hypothetical protein UT53_C0042G0005 [Candidatus Yanofskybacteria bacterium GW2011_GWD2_39_48]|uniref:Uncharacterized protein n=1 Tax=Candidatus Yanofskybacteria bacterium GW2011_GWD2_39_48 TaxID=1619031 RepID=A0A0G0P273_9BACT|nr:MAG: hypothetical protein UT53_C0042G0005 [Candidatus Yanofskybacteria bacterium GW2011_GWD2_39_48]
MAVDVIPGKDDTLALIEFVRGELERTLSEIERNKEKLFMMSRLDHISIGPICTLRIDIRAECVGSIELLSGRSKMWEKYLATLPQICPRCNGKRSVDISGSGWMAERCRGCDAKGYIPRT